MRSLSLRLALVLAFAPVVAACDSGDEGTAPVISNLAINPVTLTTGQQSTVTGSLNFEDPEAGVVQFGIDVILPGGALQSLPLSDVQGSTGLTAGTVSIAVLLIPPHVGSYRFDIWLVDDAGHESNRLTDSLVAH